MTQIKTMTLDEFHAAAKAQAPSHDQIVFRCPRCDTLQSGQDLINAGAGDDFDAVEKYLGFSCIGRFTGKGSPSEERGMGHGCNWTLGGFFQMHTFEVITPDGDHHPLFELATKEEADAHRGAANG